jgi:3-hydroxyisobutyrate dehydrogenase-like beta-hydroxyacid dehydrogenase
VSGIVNVAVAGLGKMGGPIARRLLAAGHDLTVHNRTPERAAGLVEQGARRAESPSDVWEHADVAITMILDDSALRAVTTGDGGLLDGPPAGRALVDMSTVSVAASAEVAAAAEAAGVAYLRAPVSGNPSVVEAGNLGIVVSGPKETFDRLEPLLRDIGPNVFYLGPGEEARVMKLALQVLIAGTGQLLAEALVLGEANGLDRAAMLEVLGASAVGSPFVKYKTAPLVADDYSSTFTSTAMYKDLSLLLECANGAGVPLPVSALVQQLVIGCISTGMGEDDFMALLPRLRREAGLGTT